jgi:hypothetical protein
MALPILDGNQSATTLSTIVTGGQHIPAHTVVSLGSQAITDIANAVSSVQISGTVTANVGNSITIGALPYTTTITGVGANFGQGGALAGSTVTAVPVILSSQGAAGAIQGFNGTNAFLNVGIQNVGGTSLNSVQTGLPISGTVTVGNSVTIGSIPAISGTVTANLSNVVTNNTYWGGNAIMITGEAGKGLLLGGIDPSNNPANIYEGGGVPIIPRESCPSFPISGTVTANNPVLSSVCVGAGGMILAGGLRNASNSALQLDSATGYLQTKVESMPAISGTVTANVFGQNANNAGVNVQIPVIAFDEEISSAGVPYVVPVQISNADGTIGSNNSLQISGTVTANNLSQDIYDAGNDWRLTRSAIHLSIGGGEWQEVGGSNGAENPLPISGTVTANTFALQGTAVTTSNFTSITPSTVLASFNATREVLTIFNEGAGNLHICAGATCTTIAYQVRLSAGDYYEVPNHQTSLTHSAVFATAGTARICQVS